jgi:hypothetical protein
MVSLFQGLVLRKGTLVVKLKDSYKEKILTGKLEPNSLYEEKVAIETIKIGDYVLSWNESNGKREYKKVVDTFTRQTELIYTITYSTGEKVETTWNHPFWVETTKTNLERGPPEFYKNKSISLLGGISEQENLSYNNSKPKGEWKQAKDLRIGDISKTSKGKLILITNIQTESRKETVYNFTVAENSTYYVGKDGVLVHNVDYAVNLPLWSYLMPKGWQMNNDYIVHKENFIGKAPEDEKLLKAYGGNNEALEEYKKGQKLGADKIGDDYYNQLVKEKQKTFDPEHLDGYLKNKFNQIESETGRKLTQTEMDGIRFGTLERVYDSVWENSYSSRILKQSIKELPWAAMTAGQLGKLRAMAEPNYRPKIQEQQYQQQYQQQQSRPKPTQKQIDLQNKQIAEQRARQDKFGNQDSSNSQKQPSQQQQSGEKSFWSKIIGIGKSRTNVGNAHNAENLNQELAFESVISNPAAGKQLKLNDSRWSNADGWEKRAQNINGIEIHYVYNRNTGQIDDVKRVQ